jgi:hypothetical protein
MVEAVTQLGGPMPFETAIDFNENSRTVGCDEKQKHGLLTSVQGAVYLATSADAAHVK